jgi:hypothetical protein
MNANLSRRKMLMGRNSTCWLVAGFLLLLPGLCLAASPGGFDVSAENEHSEAQRELRGLSGNFRRSPGRPRFTHMEAPVGSSGQLASPSCTNQG